MVAESSESVVESSAPDHSPVLAPGLRTALYGFLAAAGTLAVLNGVRSYQEYVNGVPDAGLHLLGVAVTLGIGFTFVLVALAGAVATGIDHAAGA